MKYLHIDRLAIDRLVTPSIDRCGHHEILRGIDLWTLPRSMGFQSKPSRLGNNGRNGASMGTTDGNRWNNLSIDAPCRRYRRQMRGQLQLITCFAAVSCLLSAVPWPITEAKSTKHHPTPSDKGSRPCNTFAVYCDLVVILGETTSGWPHAYPDPKYH